MPLDILSFAAIGALSGFFAGLLGIGGGAIITPMLIVICADKLPPLHLTHIAIATSLAVIAATAIPSAFVHAKNSAVVWAIAVPMGATAAVAAPLAAVLISHIPGAVLNGILIIFFLRVSYRMFRAAPPPPLRWAVAPPLAGAGIGGLSALLGIGGGMLTVPYLTARGVDFHRAVGTSAFIGAPLALCAAGGYIAAPVADLSPNMWGYVFLPAAFGIAVVSTVFATIGARLTGKLPVLLLRRIFAGVMLASALQLLGKMFVVLI